MGLKHFVTFNGTRGNREYRSFNGSQFLKIFFHNYSNKKSFSGETEAMHCNEKDKYSIFDELGPQYKYGDKYEFLLYYPLLGRYNVWRQSKLPFDNPETADKTADGYEEVDVKMKENGWGGLVKATIVETGSKQILSFIDGSVGTSYWFYAIGSYNYIPANNCGTNEVYLYIRIPLLNINICTRGYKYHSLSLSTSLILALMC